jgi:site-specific DNA-cytosine methylase
MNVLSLFDGISCGQLALRRAGIKVDNYFASEIDVNAIAITQNHFPKTIQLGDVQDIEHLPAKLDLLIGGSPCQGFSSAGKQLNFDDPRSQLFFDFVYILKHSHPTFFLLENVPMKKEWVDIITKHMGVEPIKINSALVSAQNRKRLYWTNIPVVGLPQDKGINFNRELYRLPHGYITECVKVFKKYPTLAAQSPGTKYRIVETDGTTRVATPEECEGFQTLPIGYTSSVNKTQRYKLIGNCWTVDVVAWIFSFMSGV